MLMKIVKIILALASCSPLMAQRDTCRNLDVPFVKDLANEQLLPGNLGFVSKPNQSAAFLTVLNRTTKRIDRITLLVEFQDDQNHTIASVPMVAGIKGSRAGASSSIYTNTEKLLESPVAPSERVELSGLTQTSHSQCPTRAVVSFVALTFEGGTEFIDKESGWRQSASISAVLPMDVKSFPGKLPFEELLSVSLDALGRLQKVNTQSDNEITKWLANQLAAWSFSAARVNGNRVPSELHLMIRLHVLGSQPAAMQNVGNTGECITVDVSFREESPRDQFIVAGGIPMLMPSDTQKSRLEQR